MGLAASRQEAFWESCGFGHLARAKHFLQEGDIDVNWVSYVNDCCPIHTASQGKPDIVDLLIANNCDVNARDGRENLAIHHAAMKGHADIIQKLIDAGSKINAQDKNGWTALHNAAYWCRPDVVNVLLKNKADVTLTNKDERTVLHECARSQDFDDCRLGKIAKMLIDAGSDVDAKSSDWGEADLTALMYAAYHNHPDVATALIDGQCDINGMGATYWTALHWAADREHDELVYILVEGGADPTKKDLKGETALDRAHSENIREVLSMAIALQKELQVVNKPIIQPITTLRKPVEPYRPKCDPNFKSQSLLPTNWTTKSDVRNLINEKKSRLAAQTSQTYRNELARRTGTNVISDGELSPDKSVQDLDTDMGKRNNESDKPVVEAEKNIKENESDIILEEVENLCDGVSKTDIKDMEADNTSVIINSCGVEEMTAIQDMNADNAGVINSRVAEETSVVCDAETVEVGKEIIDKDATDNDSECETMANDSPSDKADSVVKN